MYMYMCLNLNFTFFSSIFVCDYPAPSSFNLTIKSNILPALDLSDVSAMSVTDTFTFINFESLNIYRMLIKRKKQCLLTSGLLVCTRHGLHCQ